MLYNVTKVYVLNSQVLYVDQGEISRDSSNFNQIDVITNVTGFSAEIAFKLPNGVFSNSIGLIQQTGTIVVPSDIAELQSVAGQSWSTYTMLIDNAVLSAITSTTSQTLEFSVRFSNQITNLLVFDEFSVFPTVGEGDKVYQAEDTSQFYIWNGVNYVTKTQQEADALIITEGQVYTTEPSFLSLQGTIGGQPVALDPAFYQNQIVSSFNNLVSLYNAINNAITNTTTGLPAIAGKVSKSGDTMTGALAFSAGQQAGITRLNLNNNKVVTTDGINATTFSNGDKDSDAIKFSDLAPLFAVTAATPTGQLTWVDTFAAALANKFAGILSEGQLNALYLRRDGTVSMNGNLNMGNQSITNVNLVDNVDVSTFKTSFDNHLTNPNVHTIAQVTNLTTTLSGLQSSIDALGGAFIFRGNITNTTSEVEADKTLLTSRIDTLLDRTPETGDVLKDSDGGEWYFDGTDWRFVGQSFINVDGIIGNRTYTEQNNVTNDDTLTESVDDLDVAIGDRTYTEQNNITNAETIAKSLDDLDQVIGDRTYTEQKVVANEDTITASIEKIDLELDKKSDKLDIGNRIYRGDGEEGNNYVVTDAETVTNSILALDTEAERLNNDKMELDGSNSAVDELSFENKVDTERVSKLFVEGCCIKYEHDDGLQIRLGKELVFRNFKNASGSTITKGTPVMFGGQQGQSDVTLIKPATVDTGEFWNLIDFPQAFFGLASQDIANDDFGAITHFGDVEDILVTQTTGSVLYFDPSTGGLTATRPSGVNPEIIVGIVRRQSVGGGANGIIFVRPSISFRVEDLMGVTINNIADKESIVYDNELGYYVNKKIVLDADLFQNGLIKANLIPFQFEDVLQGYFDDGVFYAEETLETPLVGEQGKLYIDLLTNDIYRFDGTQYIVVKEAIGALGEVPDVTFTSLQSGQLLRYDGTNWVNDGLPLEDLENVVITNVANGQYLKYDNETEKWVNTDLDAPVIDSLNAIDDVDAPTPSSGDIIQYNASTSKWEKNRINFVSATAPTNPYVGDFWFDSSTLVLYVYYDDGDSVQWVNAVSGIVEGQPEELNDLTDVNIVSPTNNQVLKYNAANELWENVNTAEYLTTTIATTDWSGTEPTTAVKTVSGILSTDKPLIDIDLSSVAFANVEAKQTEYAKIFRVAATDTNEVSFFATEAPTEELVIQIKVVR